MTPLPPPPKPSETSSATRFARAALLMSMVATLAACGGGGGGSDTPSPPPPTTPPPPPPAGAIAISGVATFESIPQITGAVANAGGLNYAGATDKPIRGATVQLLAAGGAVLATTTTDPTGAYTVSLPTSQAVTVRVRAEIKRSSTTAGDRDITVVDNTNGNALYTLNSAAFTPTVATTTNLRAASGWGTTSYTGTRAAGPFAILDTIYNAQAKIQSAAATVSLPTLRINWSVNNFPSTGAFNPATGAIGTSFFTTESGTRVLYLLGKENTDTDEYDTHVVAHEYGHYLQSALSRDDSVGGSHGGDDKLDQRVAFSEGWGNGWSGIALGGPIYGDSNGAMQSASTSFTIDVSQPATGADRGAYSETTAQYLVYTSGTSGSIGFGAVYNAFVSLKNSPYWTTIYNFAAGLKGAGGIAASIVDPLWATQNTVATDALGTGETNNGGNAANLPVYKIHTAATGVAQNYCVNDTNDPNQDGNKLGEYVYIRFTVTAGAHMITAVKTSPAGVADPDFTILKADGTQQSFESGVDNSETATAVTLSAGTHTVALTDFNITTNHTSCFNFTVN